MWCYIPAPLLLVVWRPVEEQAKDDAVLVWLEREVEKAHVEAFWQDRDPGDERDDLT